LPATGWTALSATRSRYSDPLRAQGPITSVIIDVLHSKLTLKGKGASLESLAVVPTTVDVVLANGASNFCAHFGGVTKAIAGRLFQGVRAVAPTQCAS